MLDAFCVRTLHDTGISSVSDSVRHMCMHTALAVNLMQLSVCIASAGRDELLPYIRHVFCDLVGAQIVGYTKFDDRQR